jgi:hypothetical protein
MTTIFEYHRLKWWIREGHPIPLIAALSFGFIVLLFLELRTEPVHSVNQDFSEHVSGHMSGDVSYITRHAEHLQKEYPTLNILDTASLQPSIAPDPTIKAAVVILVANTTKDRIELVRCLSLYQHLFYTLYPVYVVYERSEWTDVQSQLIDWVWTQRHDWKLDMFFLPISFPPVPVQGVVPEWQKRGSTFGYSGMCMFWAKLVFEMPYVAELDYFMRLDTDSLLKSQWFVDPFQWMSDRGLVYGYLYAGIDGPDWTRRMWPMAHNYSVSRGIASPKLSRFRWPSPKELTRMETITSIEESWDSPGVPQYYNNFEIVSVPWFRRPEVRNFTDYMTLNPPHGVYRYRWGDAPLRYLALALGGARDSDTALIMSSYQHPGWLAHLEYVPARPMDDGHRFY